MDVVELRRRLIGGYDDYVESFIRIRDERVRERVGAAMAGGHLWPDPLIQLIPSFESGGTVDELVDEGLLREKCVQIFRIEKEAGDPGRPMRLHRHQADAIRAARAGANYVLTTGTGSGKSLACMVEQGRSVEVLLNFAGDQMARIGRQKISMRESPDESDPVGAPLHEDTNLESLDAIVGGPWWHEIMSRSLDFSEEVEAIVDGVCNRLKERFNEVAPLSRHSSRLDQKRSPLALRRNSPTRSRRWPISGCREMTWFGWSFGIASASTAKPTSGA